MGKSCLIGGAALFAAGIKQAVRERRDSFCGSLTATLSSLAMSTDRLAALRVSVFSFPLPSTVLTLSKANRQQDPAQNSYELNPPRQTSNYGFGNNQNLGQGNDHGNGTSDNFYDEVSYSAFSCPS